MKSYEELLERAFEKLADKEVSRRERFEIPKVSIQREGARTILKNFSQIAKTLNRSEDHLYKYIVKSLGTAGFIDNGRLILQGKFTESELQKEVDDYVKLYVLCKECNSPDTEFVKEERVLMLRCLACGAKHPVRNI
ncbi:MAG: translation initiation factor IF-2 subunit beta [Archaeoglobus sp.]|uniref:translation initiation factor IF-2 subunit beta n=1 Tax=Archaeoglobus sp. TaxID=1872626 RepID=UPI001E174647|nr:translation initiation factor IF-2 subunit beta [Archaeoglobus sp.]MBO8179197.1 translation initiation factor IF-2 subunit beta [Archaeoglobus sp.]